MSTTFEIIKFQKPTIKELLVVDRFQSYDSYRILDEDSDDTGYGIYLFRMDDKSVSNLVNSRFAVKMVLRNWKWITRNYMRTWVLILKRKITNLFVLLGQMPDSWIFQMV